MKKYIIIAGVNGSGKSTLYQINDCFKDMPRVNVDEIVREIGDWRNFDDVSKKYVSLSSNRQGFVM